MVDYQFATEQLRRMGGLNNYPLHDAPAINELVETAMTAETEAACRFAVDALLRDSDDCPTPAQLGRVIRLENERILERSTEAHKKAKCPLCGGTGFVHGVFLVTKHSREEHAWTDKQPLTTDAQIKAVRAHLQPNQQILEGSEMCQCHAGYSA